MTQESIKPSPQKVKAIENFLLSTNLKQLHHFWGVVNYYRHFIPNCAKTLHLLNALLSLGKSNKRPINWTIKIQKLFATIKFKISSLTLLSYPVPDAITTIFVDTSETSRGAVLQKKHGDAWKLLAFFSQTFLQSQRSYLTFDCELLAIYLAICYFCYFVDGQQFIVCINHALFIHPSPRQLRH